MKKYSIYFIIFSFILISISTKLFAFNPNDVEFKKIYSAPSELTGAILKDSDGFLWVGGTSEIYKYDSMNMNIYKAGEKGLSGGFISSIIEDSDKNLWFGTRDGLNMYNKETDTFTSYLNDPYDPTSISHNVMYWGEDALIEDNEGYIWIGTEGGGLNRFDKNTQTFKSYKHDPNNDKSISGNNVSCIFEDDNGILWIGTRNGLNRFDKNTQTFKRYKHDPNDDKSISGNYILHIIKDDKGFLWIGTKNNGLNRFDKNTQTFKRYKHQQTKKTTISNDFVRYMFYKNEYLWMAHGLGSMPTISVLDTKSDEIIGIYPEESETKIYPNNATSFYYDEDSEIFWIVSLEALFNYDKEVQKFSNYKSGPVVPIYEDTNGTLWLGRVGEGITKFDRQNETFYSYGYDPDDPKALKHSYTTEMFEDTYGNFYVCSHTGIISIFDRKTGKVIKEYRHDPDNPQSLGSNTRQIRVAEQDKDNPDIIWLGTYGGGVEKFNVKNGTFTHYPPDTNNTNSTSNEFAYDLYDDGNGYLWITTLGGGVDILNKNDNTFKHYKNNPDDPKTLSSNHVWGMHVQDNRTMWFFTDKGLSKFNKDNETFKTYNMDNSDLPTNNIKSLLECDNGNFWLGTDTGLVKFNPKTLESRLYTKSDGLQGNSFFETAAYKTKDGQMWFGGINGCNAFYPENITPNPFIPPVKLVSLTQSGETIIQDKAQEKIKELILDWDNNFFEFEFVALNYTKPEKNQYAYKLVGLDKEWYYSGNKRFGRYTGLDEGMYILKMKASNNDEIWNEEGTQLNIYVKRQPNITDAVYTLDEINTDNMTQHYSKNSFSIEILPLDYTLLENNYEYKLEGFDKDWLPTENHRFINYHNVIPMEYKFVLRNSDTGEIIKSFIIDIPPPFWMRWVFWTVSTILFILLITGIFLIIIRVRTAKAQLEKQSAILKKEMELAKDIQTAILPTDPKHEDFEIASVMLPADEVGGDFYDIIYSSDNRLWVGIGDVSGHGVDAGLIMMIAQTILTTSLKELPYYTPRQVIVTVNKILYESVTNRLKADKMMTLTMMRYDGEGKFTYAGAHLSLIIYRNETKSFDIIDTSDKGGYLNFIEDISEITNDHYFSLDKNDVLFLYSDGIVEASNSKEQLLELKGLLKIIEKNIHKSVDEIKDTIINETLAWCNNNVVDDITLVILKRKA